MNQEEKRYKKAQQRIMSLQEVEQRKKLLEKREQINSKGSTVRETKGNKSKKNRERKISYVTPEERRIYREKRMSRPGLVDYLNKIFMIAILLLSCHLVYITQDIHVVNNVLIEDYEVLAWLAEDDFTDNALYTWIKYNFFEEEFPVQVEDVIVKFKRPWSLVFTIIDKTLVGGALVEEEFVYYDREGVVLLKSVEQLEDILFFEGFMVESAELYEKIPVEDIEVFDNMVELSVLLDSEGLALDELMHEENNIIAKFAGIEIMFGSGNYELKIKQLEPILQELEGQEGVLDLKNYQSSDDMITFK